MKTKAIVAALTLSLSAQNPLDQGALSGQAPVVIKGRIVLYAWWPHELTASDDFVVQTVRDATTEAQFFRIVYSPVSPEEHDKPSYRLDRLAFVGRGIIWSFDVHVPQTAQEKMDCDELSHDVSVKDEQGAAKIPAYVRSPGAGDVNVPAVKTLPCYVLPVGGMRASNYGEKGQAAQDGWRTLGIWFCLVSGHALQSVPRYPWKPGDSIRRPELD